ncbi:ribbon-helix-helix protein, CopG family [Mycobacterium heidelbergense]|uniref:Ribbon-helix-helix protein CopG domain-containing protein n=1 Tax=Mycobacterium heidelbergense TaxID=53376 RepID=A0A1X0DUL6_MYCHE|nr:ribbon-helix-helix protein, CopG family [Mycobacterium heidelbergense]ORA76025.1 hypothetical protein BST25_03355 [Mycobacterium heidelbergense]
MAADYAANPPRPDEIRSVTINPAFLRKGRPTASDESSGKTPVFTVRLPQLVRSELSRRADAEGVSLSDLIRQAVVEYLSNHPVESR